MKWSALGSPAIVRLARRAYRASISPTPRQTWGRFYVSTLAGMVGGSPGLGPGRNEESSILNRN